MYLPVCILHIFILSQWDVPQITFTMLGGGGFLVAKRLSKCSLTPRTKWKNARGGGGKNRSKITNVICGTSQSNKLKNRYVWYYSVNDKSYSEYLIHSLIAERLSYCFSRLTNFSWTRSIVIFSILKFFLYNPFPNRRYQFFNHFFIDARQFSHAYDIFPFFITLI